MINVCFHKSARRLKVLNPLNPNYEVEKMEILDYFLENSCKSFISELKVGWIEGLFLILFMCIFLLIGKTIAHSILFIKKLFN